MNWLNSLGSITLPLYVWLLIGLLSYLIVRFIHGITVRRKITFEEFEENIPEEIREKAHKMIETMEY